MNFSLVTLGELLSSTNETIKRNALSILKQMQMERERDEVAHCTKCVTKNGWTAYCKKHGFTS